MAAGRKARDALNNALRLKPERLIVGDVRGAEALDLIGALAGGCDGCVCAVQAGSPRDAVGAMAAMARLAPEAPPADVLADELAPRRARDRALDALVRRGDARRRDCRDAPPMGGAAPIFTSRPEGRTLRRRPGHVPAWAEGAPPSTFR